MPNHVHLILTPDDSADSRSRWPRGRVALIVAKRTGHKVGLDTATRMLVRGGE